MTTPKLKSYNIHDLVRLSGDIPTEPWRGGTVLGTCRDISIVVTPDKKYRGGFFSIVVHNNISDAPFSFVNTGFVPNQEIASVTLQLQQISVRLQEIKEHPRWTVRRSRRDDKRGVAIFDNTWVEGTYCFKTFPLEKTHAMLAELAMNLNKIDVEHRLHANQFFATNRVRLFMNSLDIHEAARKIRGEQDDDSYAYPEEFDSSEDYPIKELLKTRTSNTYQPWVGGSLVYEKGTYAIVLEDKTNSTNLMLVKKKSGGELFLVLSTGKLAGKHFGDTSRVLHKVLLRLIAMEDEGWTVTPLGRISAVRSPAGKVVVKGLENPFFAHVRVERLLQRLLSFPLDKEASIQLQNNQEKAQLLGDIMRQLDQEHETDNLNNLAFELMPDITALQLIGYVSKATEILQEDTALTARQALLKAKQSDKEPAPQEIESKQEQLLEKFSDNSKQTLTAEQ
jgi:hypothetical protein